MAGVHHLFFSNDPDKQTLHRRIVPNARQQEKQQERWNDLRDYLVGDLGEKTGREISSWLQGSYKFGTQIRPSKKGGEFDIDLGIYFNWPGGSTEGGLSPLDLKDLVQGSLLDYESEADDDVIEVVTPPKERCSRIRFTEGFHIDVPVYHLDAGQDLRELATQKNTWEDSDPKAFYKWFKDNFDEEESSQVRRLVRYIKMWACLHLKEPPASVVTTVLVSEAYIDLSSRGIDDFEEDDAALGYVAQSIAARLRADQEVLNPINTSENLNRLSAAETDTLVEELEKLTQIAERARSASTEFEASSMWSEAFYHFFPPPIADPTDPANRAIIPVRFVPQIQVTAVPKQNDHRRFSGINKIGPIPKNCTIEFVLSNAHELPTGAKAVWIVRNDGDEAEFTNDLGHLAGVDPKKAKDESSAYRGKHYMDLIISSAFGEIIGFQRVPVEITGVTMPPRNPKKPGYTRFRRR